jgi:hypothetical protein
MAGVLRVPAVTCPHTDNLIVFSRQGIQHLQCAFRVSFVPMLVSIEELHGRYGIDDKVLDGVGA